MEEKPILPKTQSDFIYTVQIEKGGWIIIGILSFILLGYILYRLLKK